MSNKFWESNSSYVTNPANRTDYHTPAQLWEAAVEYFNFMDDNPLKQTVHSFSQGQLCEDTIDKPRAFSLMSLCRFLGISRQAWRKLKDGDLSFTDVIDQIEDVIYTQKWELAASEILNPNFIARDLGMGDKNTLLGPGTNGEHKTVSSFDVSNLTLEQLNVLEAALIEAMTPDAQRSAAPIPSASDKDFGTLSTSFGVKP